MDSAVVNAGTESARLDALHRYAILDSAPEREFDEMVARTARETGYPAAILALVESDRCWFKATTGLIPEDRAIHELPREETFCNVAFSSSSVFVVPDALEDPRFAHLKLVAREGGYRAYAGAQLITPDGFSIGTLCILDTNPREATEVQRATLRHIANEAMMLIEARRLRYAPPPAARPATSRIQAIVVDDDPSLRTVVCAMLRHLGYGVLEAGSGVEALRIYHEQPSAVQLVLTDLYMREMDGLALIRALRREPRPPALIAMSGRFDPRVRETLYQAGALALLDKPFTLESLQDALTEAVAR